MATPASERFEEPGSWETAPCGLLRIDGAGLVLEANWRFLGHVGRPRGDVVGQMHWTDLLSVGSRIFFQSQLEPVLELDGALSEVMLDLRPADGSPVPVLVNAVRVIGDDGRREVRIAVMSVPDRRAYEEDLRAAREQAEHARSAGDHARRRLELLARANTALASSIDVEVALGRLATALVADLADWCLIYVDDPVDPDQPPRWAAAHTDPAAQDALNRLAELIPDHALPQSGLRRVLDSGQPVLLAEVSDEHRRTSTDSPEVHELYLQVGLGSAIVVPSTARASRVATIILVRGPGRDQFAGDDLADLADLGARAGIVIDNLARHAREHDNSVALQQALLTAPPRTPGLEIVTRYLPATDGNEVGGDWYDAFRQPDGRPVVVIGDVVGHDIRAAAAMGQLRGVLRTIGYTDSGTPAAILARADATADGLSVGVMASAFVARVEAGEPGPARLRWSNAGHPPPVLLRADGTVVVLDAPSDLLLGIEPDRERHDHTEDLAVGDTVLLYTDGLIERSDEDLDTGIERLQAALSAGAGLSLDELCDAVVQEHHSGRRDDIAILALRWLGRPDDQR
jgi:GAF domain-containing protein